MYFCAQILRVIITTSILQYSTTIGAHGIFKTLQELNQRYTIMDIMDIVWVGVRGCQSDDDEKSRKRCVIFLYIIFLSEI